MKVLLQGRHLVDQPEPATVPVRFVRVWSGFEACLGNLPILRIEAAPNDCFGIRTVPGGPQLATAFVNLHSAVCAAEHLIQTGGASEWMFWPRHVADPHHQTVRIDLV
jgi:hypothetical protein